jgi:hypothetical protein
MPRLSRPPCPTTPVGFCLEPSQMGFIMWTSPRSACESGGWRPLFYSRGTPGDGKGSHLSLSLQPPSPSPQGSKPVGRRSSLEASPPDTGRRHILSTFLSLSLRPCRLDICLIHRAPNNLTRAYQRQRHLTLATQTLRRPSQSALPQITATVSGAAVEFGVTLAFGL